MILRALIRTRMLALRRSLRQSMGNKGKALTILLSALMVYAVGCIVFLAVMMNVGMCGPLAGAGLSWLYFAMAALSAFTLGFFVTVFMAERQLFAARDNELLLSLPIPARDILISRMLILALSTYLGAALMLIPAGVVYAVTVGFTAAGAVFYVLAGLVLPLGSLALACLVGQVLAWLSARARHKSLTSVLATALFLGLYFAAVGNGNRALSYLVQNGGAVAAHVQFWAAPAYWFGMAAMGSTLCALAAVALPVLGFVLVYIWLGRSFYRITTTRVAAPKVRYREKRAARQSARRALWLCELRHFGATPGWVVNGGMGALMAVACGVVLLIKRDALEQLFAVMPGAVPAAGLLAAAMCFCTGTCLISSASISLQGKTLWILRSCPVQGGTVLKCMAAVQMTVSMPAMFLGSLLGALGLGLDAVQTAAVLAAGTAYAVLTAYLGVAINVCWPKFDWMTETQAVKQSLSTLLAMLVGFVLVAVPGLVYYLLQKNVPSADTVPFLWECAAVYALLALAAARWLRDAGAARFAAL